jgi:hypothetical protein
MCEIIKNACLDIIWIVIHEKAELCIKQTEKVCNILYGLMLMLEKQCVS